MSIWYALCEAMHLEFLHMTFMKNALLAVLILAPLFGLLSTMIVTGRMSFFSDALGHSGFTGIAVGVLCGAVQPIGWAVGLAVLFALLFSFVRSRSRQSADTIIGVFSSTAVALGIFIATLGGSSFTKVWENADGSLLKAGEWIFTGDDIVQLSKEENSSVLFTVCAHDADDTLLGEGTFLYDAAQEKLYVTISADGVTCSTTDAPDAPADVPPVLTLPILDEIERTVTTGTSGSSLLAVQEAAKLLDWGVNTGLGADEISDATSTWLAARNNDLTDCLKKLELVDDAYQKLLTDEARELLDSAGCEDVEITWGSDPVEPVEAIMQAAGLRG